MNHLSETKTGELLLMGVFCVFTGILLSSQIANSLLLMAEILHQLIGSLSHYLPDFIHPRWLAGFQPSTVVHQVSGFVSKNIDIQAWIKT